MRCVGLFSMNSQQIEEKLPDDRGETMIANKIRTGSAYIQAHVRTNNMLLRYMGTIYDLSLIHI